MNIHQSCKIFLSPPAKPVEIENKIKYLMRKPISSVFEEKNVKYHKKVTMYPRLTIPKYYFINYTLIGTWYRNIVLMKWKTWLVF